MEQDTLHRFLIENTHVRGEWVHLDTAWQDILGCADYPPILRHVLGEAAAAVCLMSATIKFEGSLILQINSSGPVSMLVMQATSDGEIRGLAQWDGELPNSNFNDLFGDGQIVISIITDKEQDRYQGIVSLDGPSLSDCLTSYFEQSEQLRTRLHLAADSNTAAGFLIQSLPDKEYDKEKEFDIDGWDRAVGLSDTIKTEELLSLDVEVLLYRLFHEENLRLFEAKPIRYKCSCSQQKIEGMIRSLGQQEAINLVVEQGNIEINCEFCNMKYSLDAIDVAAIFDSQISDGGDSVH